MAATAAGVLLGIAAVAVVAFAAGALWGVAVLVATATGLATAAALGFTLFAGHTRALLPPVLLAGCSPGDNAPVGKLVVVLHRQAPTHQRLVRASDRVFWGSGC